MKSYFDILDAAAQSQVSDQVNLMPQLRARLKSVSRRSFPTRKLALATFVILLAFISLLLTVPGFAQALGRWLGFIPGVGVFDTSAPLRVLAEPVTLTRDGITLTVEEALLSADQTTITYSVAGVPSSAYPHQEDVIGCYTTPYLELPDAGTLQITSGSGGGFAVSYRNQMHYAAVPAEINAATFVVPCLDSTLPGSVPENWRLPLQFVAAPAYLTIMPVFEVPTPTVLSETQSSSALPSLLTLDQVIELDDGYIFVGSFHTVTLPNGMTAIAMDQTARLIVRDAAGNDVSTLPAPDTQAMTSTSDNFPWAFQVEGKSFAWPLTITLEKAIVTLPSQEDRFEFDTGPDPQEGQEWVLNKDFQFEDYTVRLVSIQRLADGYAFTLQTDPSVISVGAWIDGFQAAGGGGGSDGQGNFDSSVVYAGELPAGKLTIVISAQMAVITDGPWSATWQPEGAQNQPQVTATENASLCVADAASLDQGAPTSMSGKVLLYHLLDDGETWAVTLSNLDGSQQQMVGTANGWSALSPDGSTVAYSDAQGLASFDVASGAISRFSGIDGYNISWSPDGTRLAYIGAGAGWEIYSANADGTGAQQLTTDGYPKAVAGWSPDGQVIYYTANSADGQVLWALDLTTRSVHSVLTLENASFKAAYAKISPDGQWVAYRDTTLSNLYLVKLDNSEQRIVLRAPSDAISAIEWSGDWLGISLANPNSDTRSVMLLDPQTCEAYLLPNLHGDLMGLWLP